MSFFIKKNIKNGYNKFSSDNSRKRKFPKNQEKNEEISSSDEDVNENSPDKSSSEDENETAQEKKVRLAKIYLEEIKKAEKKQLENKELDDACRGDVVQRRLKEDYLKQAGKLRLAVAKKYTVNFKDITVLKCKEHGKALTALCISNDNKFIYSGSKDGSVVKWSINDKQKVLSLPYTKDNDEKVRGHCKTILSIALSWDSKFLAVGDESHDIQIWNPELLQHINTLKGHRGAVTGLVFRKDTHVLYSSSKDRCVKVWTLDEMSYVETLYGHLNGITSIDALSRERALTAGGGDTTIRLWKIAEESQLIYNGDSGSIDCVKLINEDYFISGGDAGDLCVWSSNKKKALCVKKNPHGLNKNNEQPNWVVSVASLVNTDLIASGSNDGTIKLWRILENYRGVEHLLDVPFEGFINALCFSNDGKYLIAGVGREHRFGRWEVMKTAKNSIVLIPLEKQDN